VSAVGWSILAVIATPLVVELVRAIRTGDW
jgi:hypothetical protein